MTKTNRNFRKGFKAKRKRIKQATRKQNQQTLNAQQGLAYMPTQNDDTRKTEIAEDFSEASKLAMAEYEKYKKEKAQSDAEFLSEIDEVDESINYSGAMKSARIDADNEDSVESIEAQIEQLKLKKIMLEYKKTASIENNVLESPEWQKRLFRGYYTTKGFHYVCTEAGELIRDINAKPGDILKFPNYNTNLQIITYSTVQLHGLPSDLAYMASELDIIVSFTELNAYIQSHVDVVDFLQKAVKDYYDHTKSKVTDDEHQDSTIADQEERTIEGLQGNPAKWVPRFEGSDDTSVGESDQTVPLA